MSDEHTHQVARWAHLPGVGLRLGIALAAAVLLDLSGRPSAARTLISVVLVLTVASALSARLAALLERATGALGRAVGACIATLAIVLIDLVVGIPGRAASIIRRRSPLTDRGSGASTSWRVTPIDRVGTDADRSFGGDLPGRRRGAHLRGVPYASALRALGILAVLLVLNSIAGTISYVVDPGTEGAAIFREHTRLDRVGELAPIGGRPVTVAPVSDPGSRALQGASWAKALGRAEGRLEYHWLPYVTARAVDADGPLVTISAGVRSSWVAPGVDSGRPVVWFFGSSAMQGIGQRNGHTIPSDVARLAAAAGTPITVVNFGVPGATNFMEALLLEQQVAVRPKPAAVVFYDGAADLGVQSFYPARQPTHAELVVKYRSTHPSAYEQWVRSSLAHRLFRGLDHMLFPAAGAVATQSQEPPTKIAAPAVVARNTLALYARGRAFVAGALPGVPALYFWQPTQWGETSTAAAMTRSALPPGVTDLSDTFDGVSVPIYIDPIHTNERGAKLIAARMWPTIEEELG